MRSVEEGLCLNAIRAGGIVTPALTELFLTSEESRRQLEDFVPLGRLAEPEEVADVALFLLSDLSRYVTGTVLTTDDGSLLLG